MVYRVSPLTWVLGKPLVRLPFYAMVNLIAGRVVAPELVQHDFRAERVVQALAPIMADGPIREKMLADFTAVRHALQAPQPPYGGERHGSAAERAAEAILYDQQIGIGNSPANPAG
jgi:lipid-A-disaccharide synthase